MISPLLLVILIPAFGALLAWLLKPMRPLRNVISTLTPSRVGLGLGSA